MIFDLTHVIIIALLLLLALLTPLFNPFFRSLKPRKKGEKKSTCTQPLSIIIPAHNGIQGLNESLNSIMEQDYASEYEIIVVAEQGDIGVETLLKSRNNDKRIYTTFVPHRPIFMSKDKLAITLGVKAARNEWIVLMECGSVARSNKWLASLSRNTVDGCDIIIAYSNYAPTTKQFYRFCRLRTALYIMREAARGKAYRANGYNIVFRKSIFIDGDGYRDNLQFPYGESDFIINKFSEKGNTAVETSPESATWEARPTLKQYNSDKLRSAETLQHLHISVISRIVKVIDTTAMLLNYAVIIGAAVGAAIYSDWLIMAVAMIAAVVTVALRTSLANRAAKKMGEKITPLYIVPYEIAALLSNIATTIRRALSDRSGFTTHKI